MAAAWRGFRRRRAGGVAPAELRFRLPSTFLDWIGPACLGYSTKAVELAGGRDVRVCETGRRATGGDGGDEWEVTFGVHWSERK